MPAPFPFLDFPGPTWLGCICKTVTREEKTPAGGPHSLRGGRDSKTHHCSPDLLTPGEASDTALLSALGGLEGAAKLGALEFLPVQFLGAKCGSGAREGRRGATPAGLWNHLHPCDSSTQAPPSLGGVSWCLKGPSPAWPGLWTPRYPFITQEGGWGDWLPNKDPGGQGGQEAGKCGGKNTTGD